MRDNISEPLTQRRRAAGGCGRPRGNGGALPQPIPRPQLLRRSMLNLLSTTLCAYRTMMTNPDDDDDDPWHLTSPGCHVALTHSPLDIPSTMALVRSPSAGAIVLFAGTSPSPPLYALLNALKHP
ncbi:Molybdopterin synthase catalytic subunit [Beauveria bassiana D1-5]|uniref:Molybdopterin synthase catalytic subunit n=1 Tax=Beauveria bassiana D1-5 TaxID=1245745 RepID=A0A0A2VI15_BEABA|nr:Molybdopterin synthase catalytic subunit [Beauveria bassiana D1-5]